MIPFQNKNKAFWRKNTNWENLPYTAYVVPTIANVSQSNKEALFNICQCSNWCYAVRRKWSIWETHPAWSVPSNLGISNMGPWGPWCVSPKVFCWEFRIQEWRWSFLELDVFSPWGSKPHSIDLLLKNCSSKRLFFVTCSCRGVNVWSILESNWVFHCLSVSFTIAFI